MTSFQTQLERRIFPRTNFSRETRDEINFLSHLDHLPIVEIKHPNIETPDAYIIDAVYWNSFCIAKIHQRSARKRPAFFRGSPMPGTADRATPWIIIIVDIILTACAKFKSAKDRLQRLSVVAKRDRDRNSGHPLGP